MFFNSDYMMMLCASYSPVAVNYVLDVSQIICIIALFLILIV